MEESLVEKMPDILLIKRSTLRDFDCFKQKLAETKITPSQVVKVVHDDSNEEVDHDEGAEEDEGDEVDVGDVRAAALVGVNQLAGR